KMLLAVNPATIAPGPLMVTLGLVSLVFAVFMLYRRRDIKRMFAYSSIEHMGIITFAFGMGGPAREFRWPVAHDHALAHHAGDIFRRRPYRAGQRHTAYCRYRRSHRDPSDPGLDVDPRRCRHCRLAAARDFHERVSGRQLHVCAGAGARARARLRHPRWRRGSVSAIEQHRVWRTARAKARGTGLLGANVRPARFG